MSRWRSGGVFTALVISQSCWLFLLAGLVGAASAGQRALLTWPGIFLLLVAGASLTRRLGSSPLPEHWVKLTGVFLSFVLIYSALALQYGGTWPMHFSTQPGGALETSRLGLACVLALGIWWRGTRTGSTTDPEGALRLGFRIGLIVLVLAAVVEAAYHRPLGVGAVAFPFFAASLAGLALLTLEADDQQRQTRWGRMLVGSIGGALAIGAIASLGVGGVLSGAASHLFRGLGVAGYYVSFAAFFVLEYVIRGLFWLIRSIGDLFGDPDVVRFLRPPTFLSQRPEVHEAQQVAGAWGAVVSGVKWGLLALLILGVLLFLAWLFRRRQRLIAPDETEVRESIRDENAPEGSLLGALLPHIQARERPTLYPLPPGADPANRLYRIYFHALNVALQHGQPRKPSETPNEYAPRLAAALPGTPSAELSQSFVRARYGGWVPPPEVVQELEQGMNTTAPKPPQG